MSESSPEEVARVLAERDWWRSLAERLGMRLYGWNGAAPHSSASFSREGDHSLVEVDGRLAQAIHDALKPRAVLDALTDEERTELFAEYCRACGSKDPGCVCWRDE